MEDLKKEDYKELVAFYKNKSTELEWALLLQQIKYNNTVKEKDKKTEELLAGQLERITDGQKDHIEKLTIEKNHLVKELEKYRKKNINNKKIK